MYFSHSGFWVTYACPEKQSCPEFTVLNIQFIIQDFSATRACPEKQSCPEIFHCIEYTFHIQDFWATCACPEKQSVPENFHCIENVFFIIQNFSAARACPEKQSCPENFHCTEYTFYIQDLWGTCACPENFHCNKIYFIIQDFSATRACPEKQSCPAIFHCIEYTFYIQDFWVTCPCPEKQRGPEFTVLKMYFLLLRIFEQLALALKNRVALECFTEFKYFFIIRDFCASSACPENRVCPEFFPARGGCRSPRPPPRTPMLLYLGPES